MCRSETRDKERRTGSAVFSLVAGIFRRYFSYRYDNVTNSTEAGCPSQRLAARVVKDNVIDNV